MGVQVAALHHILAMIDVGTGDKQTIQQSEHSPETIQQLESIDY